MSSIAGPLSAPARSAVPGRGRALARPRTRVGADASVCAGVGLTLAGVAFAASGGTQLARTTYTEVALMLGGAILVSVTLLSSRSPGRLWGSWTLAGLVALAALTILSITWSLTPGETWTEANRMLAYVAAFAGGLSLVRLAPGRWAGMIGGVALGCLLVVVWALLTKVFPGALAPDETFARLQAPFDYWNAMGLTAALALPPLLWLAAKRSGNLAGNALAYPALGLCHVCVLLSYSRGALLATAVGLAFWFAVVPLRLRAATALVVSAIGATLVVAWAFSREGLTSDDVALNLRAEAGHELGALLALLCVVLLAAGLAIGFAAANRSLSRRARRGAGRALVALLALVPLTGLVGLAGKPGGIDGQVSRGWSQLTDPAADTPANSPGRLTATGSVRSRYWREAMDIWSDKRGVGAGAGSFAVARTRYRTGSLEVRQAHGYVVETLAGLGLAGLAVSVWLLVAWVIAAARATGLRRGDRGLPMDAERVGLLTLCAVVVVFGVHSLVDWTWLVPGTAAIALACAAWVAGRGPLRARLEAVDEAGQLPPRLHLLAAAGVLLVALAASWAGLQPVRSVHASNVAFDRLDAGETQAALETAGIAVERNPLAVDPLFDLATIQSATGRNREAERTLERAVEREPANAEAWRRLGEFRAVDLARPREGLASLRAAYYLDPESQQTKAAFLLLRRQLALTEKP